MDLNRMLPVTETRNL